MTQNSKSGKRRSKNNPLKGKKKSSKPSGYLRRGPKRKKGGPKNSGHPNMAMTSEDSDALGRGGSTERQLELEAQQALEEALDAEPVTYGGYAYGRLFFEKGFPDERYSEMDGGQLPGFFRNRDGSPAETGFYFMLNGVTVDLHYGTYADESKKGIYWVRTDFQNHNIKKHFSVSSDPYQVATGQHITTEKTFTIAVDTATDKVLRELEKALDEEPLPAQIGIMSEFRDDYRVE